MIAYLSAGVVLGFSAGFSPGPLFALVLSQTLRHGIREGCKVAMAPLLTDLPLILVSILLLRQLADFTTFLGVISLVGAGYLLQMAYGTFRSGLPGHSLDAAAPQSLGRGMLVNALSPHPYIFWFSVGAPTILKGMNTGTPLAGPAFVVGFLGCLVGAKMVLAVVVGKSRRFMEGKLYLWIMRCLGLLLLVFAGMLAKEGCLLLGLLKA